MCCVVILYKMSLDYIVFFAIVMILVLWFTAEAKALRNLIIIRDDRLNKNCFLRHARADFFQLCVYPFLLNKVN